MASVAWVGVGWGWGWGSCRRGARHVAMPACHCDMQHTDAIAEPLCWQCQAITSWSGACAWHPPSLCLAMTMSAGSSPDTASACRGMPMSATADATAASPAAKGLKGASVSTCMGTGTVRGQTASACCMIWRCLPTHLGRPANELLALPESASCVVAITHVENAMVA